MSKKEKMSRVTKGLPKDEMILVEFKAPRKLVEASDLKSKSRFSSRSEAIRALMRSFLDEMSVMG